MTVGKWVYKNYGVDINTLKYNTLPEQFFEYEEMMLVDNDYEYANYLDTKPKT